MTTAKSPKVLFFDVGNVLLFFSHEKMFEQIASVCETDLPTIQNFFKKDQLQLRYEAGQVTTEEIFHRLSAIAGRPLCSDDVNKAMSEIFHLNDPILPILRELREGGHRLMILSNIGEAHRDYIDQQYGLFDPFEELVFSYEIGAIKPDRKIYEAAIERAGCDPKECFYTDDIPAYVEAARSLAIDAEPFTGVDALRMQLQNRELLT